ncbi:unnamed protein product [Caenorhabditis auriculariae]|uniref:Transmembrane protein n=1 Tax=Caenorhabditis auriculariae TaxID=2777116 RepID=A0A8S1HGN4_9PELO|nr:unnamed protein product [Caenorhabditis auriculariae]
MDVESSPDSKTGRKMSDNKGGPNMGQVAPVPFLIGLGGGFLFGIFLLILHVVLVKKLVKDRLKHMPKARKVKVKKGKKAKKGGKDKEKKEKKGKKSKK